MRQSSLTPTSYVVLGLAAGMGPVTPYEMKQMVGMSVGYFWSFPHSQLYREPARLVGLGLMEVEREQGGRRRKRYSVTESGREVLAAWVRDPETEGGEIRDPAVLKLFFGAFVGPDDVRELARHQAESLQWVLGEYDAIDAAISHQPELAFPRLTLELGRRVAQTTLRFWEEVEASAPRQ